MKSNKSRISTKTWLIYFSAIFSSIVKLALRNKSKIFLCVLFIFVLHQTFFDSTAFESLKSSYSDLQQMEKLQLLILVTMISGFIINHISMTNIEKWKFYTTIKINQAERITFYANEMCSYCTDTSLFVGQIKYYYNAISNCSGDDERAYWTNIFKNEYHLYISKIDSKKTFYNDFMSFTSYHNNTYIVSNQHSKLSKIGSLFHEVYIESISIKSYLDTDKEFNLLCHLEYLLDKDIDQIAKIADRAREQISPIASSISTTLTKDIQDINLKTLIAIIQSPRFLQNSLNASEGKEPIDKELLDKICKKL